LKRPGFAAWACARVAARWAWMALAVPKCTEAGGVQPDPGVAMVVVIGGEELVAERSGVLQ
jgi:hypothetical protein